MTVTVNYNGSYNGLSFGPGTQVMLIDYDAGLATIPNLRTGDVPNARRDGATAGLDLLGERIFVVTLQPFIQSTTPFQTLLAQIAVAFQPIANPGGSLPFELLLPGWANSRLINCRPTQVGYPIDSSYQFNVTSVPIQMTASDPLVYSSVLKTASAVLPSPTAGLKFPVTFPVTFGASSGGSMSVTNSGNYITPPVFTITGPVLNPVITFTSTGQFLGFTISLGASDVLVIDTNVRTVQLNGSAYRFNTIMQGSTWFGIPAPTPSNPTGTWSIAVSSSDATAVAAVFSVAYRDAYSVF